MNVPSTRTTLDEFVEAFETAQQRDGGADPADFLPHPDHPLYAVALRELVRIDLDYGWERGRPTPLDDYHHRFPGLFQDPEGLRAVVWEEYRQRRQSGEEPDPDEYQRRYGVSPLGDTPADADGPRTLAVEVTPLAARPLDGPAARKLADRLDQLGLGSRADDRDGDARRSDAATAEGSARAPTALPEVGDTFLGFHLEAELGRGAFGRVFLARQGELANRPVALKIATQLFDESQALAELQHVHNSYIMPIYSWHQTGSLQALCMPYLGGTTLAHVLKALKGKALPTSGKHLVSTLHDRKSVTLPGAGFRVPASGSGRIPVNPDTRDSDPGLRNPEPETHNPTPAALEALERLSYVGAVLWLGAKLADGLAHAHERGILHRDLKPANVLLTDDGQPMLLDFNLADDANAKQRPRAAGGEQGVDRRGSVTPTKPRPSEAGVRVGGTLPYMAPEQLGALLYPTALPMDGRGDLYALGLILYELLTGRHPFEIRLGSGSTLINQMLADRRTLPPLRPYNSAVSPAVEAIVRRCLELDPAKRYQSARHLKEDLERHLANLPLKHTPEPSLHERAAKWGRRHPRLTSAASVGSFAAAAVVVLGLALSAAVHEVRQRRAADALRGFDAAAAEVTPRLIRSLDAGKRDAALHTAHEAVARYGVFDRPDWAEQRLVIDLPPAEQDRLRGRVGEMLFLMTQAKLDQAPAAGASEQVREALRFNDLVAVCYREDNRPQAWWEQRADVLRRLGERDQADGLADRAKQIPLRTGQDHYLHAVRLCDLGRYRDALVDLRAVTNNLDPRHYWAWSLRGYCHYALGQDAEAADSYSHCISLAPDEARPSYNRGRVMTRLQNHRQAVADLERAVRNDPESADFRIELALARVSLALSLTRPTSLAAAEADLVRGTDRRANEEQRKLFEAAESDMTQVLGRADAPVRCYFHRSRVRLLRGDKAGADADLKAGFDHEPDDDDDLSWVTRGFQRMQQNQFEQALADFRRAEAINPRNFHALQNQAHILSERLQRPRESLDVLNRLLELYPEWPQALGGRAVLLARAGRVPEALDDVKRLLQVDPSPFAYYQAAGVYALTADQPGHLREALRLLAKALSRGEGYAYIGNDPDLDPIREQPEFRTLLNAVRTLQTLQK